MRVPRIGGAPRGAAALLLLLILAGPAGGPAAAEPRIQVEYRPPVLTVEAREADLADVLRAIGQKLGFSVVEAGGARPPVTVSLSGSVSTVLRQILVGTSHALVYREVPVGSRPGPGDIEAVVMLGAGAGGPAALAEQPSAAPEAAEEDMARLLGRKAAEDSIPKGSTSEVSAGLPRAAGSREEQPEDSPMADAQPVDAHLVTDTVSGLLRAQAVATIPTPEATDGPQLLPWEEVPTSDAVATMMRRAQQGIEALVRALQAAGAALTESAATSGQ